MSRGIVTLTFNFCILTFTSDTNFSLILAHTFSWTPIFPVTYNSLVTFTYFFQTKLTKDYLKLGIKFQKQLIGRRCSIICVKFTRFYSSGVISKPQASQARETHAQVTVGDQEEVVHRPRGCECASRAQAPQTVRVDRVV